MVGESMPLRAVVDNSSEFTTIYIRYDRASTLSLIPAEKSRGLVVSPPNPEGNMGDLDSYVVVLIESVGAIPTRSSYRVTHHARPRSLFPILAGVELEAWEPSPISTP